jgi:ketosteroid isomerase-like protein
VSKENLELTLTGWDFMRRTGRVDLNRLHPDIVWHTRGDLPDSQTYRGHDGIQALFDNWAATFRTFSVEVEELIDAGDGVIAMLRLTGAIGDTDQQVEMTEAHLTTWRDGKAIEVREFATRDEALEAAGMAAPRSPR